MKASDVIANFLKKQGVQVIFGYQGGAITHMIDSFDRAGIHYIQTYNEQGAALAADAYARVADLGLGVAIATNGPGATNLITGIANAYCDSIPVLYLTGQVHTFAMKQSQKIRQESFQEIDIISMVKPITKYAVTVLKKEQIIPELQKAIQIAREGRPGPVVVDLPVDIQGQDIEENAPAPANEAGKNSVCPEEWIREVAELINGAKRPLIIAGAGVQGSRASGKLQQFVDKTNIPVVASLLGLDALAHKNIHFVGYIGSYGNRYANMAVQNADCILVLGSRLDMRQTGKRKDLFAPYAKVIHVDIDEMELEHFIKEEYSICCDVNYFLTRLLAEQIAESEQLAQWWDQISEWKRKYPSDGEFDFAGEGLTNPNAVMKQIGTALPENSVVCADVGQNQMWLAQSLRLSTGRILNSGGLGTMGYALPAAIGAYYGTEGKQTVAAVMGDGGLQMNIQELQVIGQRQLPIAVFVMNNHALGLIRETHEKYYNKRYVGSVDGFSMPDLSFLARAYSMKYDKIQNMEQLEKVTAELGRLCEPRLIEIEFEGNTYVRPELLGNDGLDHQYPYKD